MLEKMLRSIETKIEDCVRKDEDFLENRKIMTMIKDDELSFFNVRDFKKITR